MAQRGNGPGYIPLLLVKLALVVAGYVIAVAAATAMTVGLLQTSAALSVGSPESAHLMLTDVPYMLAAGSVWTFICALPGFVAAIVMGERQHWQHWYIFAFAGLLNVVPSVAISGGITGELLVMPDFLFAAFSGGFVGGAAYWAAAGRFVAARRL